jgi:hypothetical protein
MPNPLEVATMAFTIAGFLGTIPPAPVAARNESRACTSAVLPAELQRHIQTDFPSWRPQNVSTLSANAKERWQSEKPLDCPGIAIGLFENMNQRTYAVLLVPANNPDAGYRLLAFTPHGGQSPDAFRVIEQSDKIGASNFFVHQIRIAKVFRTEGVRKLRINTRDGILFVGSGKSEYETDVYFWTGTRYRHEPIDY